MATWDKEAVYDEQIFPLMDKIIEICKEHKIPMVASFEYASRGNDDSDLCTTYMAFDEAPACSNLRLAERAITHGVASALMAATLHSLRKED